MRRTFSALIPSLTLALLLAAGVSPAGAEESLPNGAKVVRLEAHPAEIELEHAYDYRQLLLTAQLADGGRLDATRMAELATKTDLVTLDRGLIRPQADGRAELEFRLGGQSVTVPVEVRGQQDAHPVSFVQDVMPVLSKAGCNAGTCHGSQDGQAGFKLSLRGYDPLFDHRALIDDLAGRRFNRAAPEKSLMLMKPAGEAPHSGGVLFHAGDRSYNLIRAWIASGVKLDLDAPRVASIELEPQEPIVPLPGQLQQMRVIATYADGTRRDVTAQSFVSASNSDVAEVDDRGLVTTLRRGETAVLARYEGAYAATTMICMGDRSGFAWNGPPVNNYIDELVYEKLQRVKTLPSGLCSDEAFIRRVYLDLTGLPPTADAVREFVADSRDTQTKRNELIDRLIGSPDFVEYWTNKWCDLLQVNTKFLGEEGAWALRNWVRSAVQSNMPYDEMAYQVLTGSGSNLQNPPAAYYKVLRDPTEAMENTTQLFLAVRFSCNKCHDHPFERWTQDQYYHLAAYFAQVGLKESPEAGGKKIGGSAVEGATPLVEIVYDKNGGEVTHARTGQTAEPAFPYQPEIVDAGSGSRREQLARWVTSPENRYFARSYVNRIWAYLTGRGLIEPIDDIRAGNPPTNPKLLDKLEKEFIDSGFDTQHMMRVICRSRVYQHAIATNEWNEEDTINYSHATARRLPAEVLYDAVHRVTGSTPNLPGLPAGFRSVQLVDPSTKVPDDFFTLFGKPPRESACECERNTDNVAFGQALNLVNGPTVANAIGDPGNDIARLIGEQKDNRKIVEELFLRILNRKPTDQEVKAGVAAVTAYVEEQAALKAELEAYRANELPKRMRAWAESVDTGPVQWTPLEASMMIASSGAKLEQAEDGSILVSGKAADKDTYTVIVPTKLEGITGVRLEALPHDSLGAKGPGRAQNGNFVLNELTLRAASQGSSAKLVDLTNASADFSQANWDVAGAVDGQVNTGWAVSPQFGQAHEAIFETAETIAGGEGTVLTFTFRQEFGRQHVLGRFRLSATTAKRPLIGDRLPPAIAKIIDTPAEERTDAQNAELLKFYATIDPELARLEQQAAAAAVNVDPRLKGAQDLAWALINSPAFLFNH